ncbi:hypothetical protein ACKWTF_001987 [Chironomus riparius]
MFLSKILTIWALLTYTIYLLSHSEGAVIRPKEIETDEISPYLKAFSSHDRLRIAEYERLKRSLMHFKPIDWNVVVQPRISDTDSSSS